MGEQLTEAQAKKLIEITQQLKHLMDMGAIGARAASTDSSLVPGDLIDLTWRLIFGKSREESLKDEKARGAAFVLSVWNGHPMIGWHLNNIPREDIVMILATAVAMVGKRVGDGAGIIDEMIVALEALKQHGELSSPPNDEKTH